MTSALGYAIWSLLLLGAVVLWAFSHAARGPAVARPSVVLARLATAPCLRIILVVAYLWLGWHLFAR